MSMEKTRSDSLVEELQCRVSRQDEVISNLKETSANLTHDVDQIVSVVRTARATGRWDIDTCRFRELTHEQVFGGVHETFAK